MQNTLRFWSKSTGALLPSGKVHVTEGWKEGAYPLLHKAPLSPSTSMPPAHWQQGAQGTVEVPSTRKPRRQQAAKIL